MRQHNLFLIPVILLMLGAGCGASVDTSSTASVTPPAKVAPTPAPKPQPTPAALASVVTVTGLSFTLPKDWILRDITHEKNAVSAWDVANINVPDLRWHVAIPLKVYKSDVKIDATWKLLTQTSTGAKIYADTCAPAIACYQIAYKGTTYAVGFGEPESDEPPPTNLDGVWFPSTTVTAAQTLDVVSTVK